MSKEYKPMFYLSDEELQKAGDWKEAHDKERHILPGQNFRYNGAIGGAYTWCFTPTSLGVICKVQCSCGEELDLTDYDAW